MDEFNPPMMPNVDYSVPLNERMKLIQRLARKGFPQPELLFDAGVRHPEYIVDYTDDQLISIGITPEQVQTIREKSNA